MNGLRVGPCVVCGQMMDIVDPHLVPTLTVNGRFQIVWVHRGHCARVLGAKKPPFGKGSTGMKASLRWQTTKPV